MPFAPEPRARVVGTGPACRAVVAARILAPGTEWQVFRALQFAWFTTTLLLDRYLLVPLPLAIEVAEHGVAEGADRGEAGQLKRRAS